MVPEIGDFLLYQFSPNKLECQPEPPWIKRCSYGITFIDDAQFEEEVDFWTSSERNTKKEESENELYQESEIKIIAKTKVVSEKITEKKKPY